MNKKCNFSSVKKFFHQLKLLLWKNFTIKRRSLFVFMFELTVPLVLFLIMFAIRQKQHAKPVNTVFFDAWALPSAGFVPLMQGFCRPENGVRNENGFLEYPNSTAKEMLEQIDNILKSNWSSTWFQKTSHISPTFKDEQPTKNLNTLSDQVLKILLNNTNMPASYDSPHEKSINKVANLDKYFSHILDSTSNNGHRQNLMFNTDTLNRKKLHYLLVEKSNMPEPLFDQLLVSNITIDNDEMRSFLGENVGLSNLQDLKSLSSSKSKRVDLMGKLFCDRNKFLKIIHIQTSANSSSNMSDINGEIQPYLCKMKSNDLSDLETVLYDDDNIVDDDYLRDLEFRLNDFLNFQQAIDDLSALSLHFPMGLCRTKNAETIMREGDEMRSKRPDSFMNETYGDSTLKKKLMKDYGFIGLWYSMQKTFCGAEPMAPTTTTTSTTTSTTTTTYTRSTTNASTTDAIIDDAGSQFDLLNLSYEQLKSLSLLFHVLYSNPVILYTPNTTLVTETLIRKSNGTFELLDKINMFFRQWLETSSQLVKYLKHEQTNQSLSNLHSARMLAVNVSEMETPTGNDQDIDYNFNKTTKLSLNATQLEENLSYLNSIKFFERMPNSTIQDLIDRIEMIDSAACSWLSLMSGVNLNLFKGFATENDLVNYFLQRAYFDNVTVIASLVFDLKNVTSDTLDPHITYKIRQNASFTYTTKKIRERYWYPSPRDWDYYYYIFGFVWLQDLIDRAIIDYHSNATILEPGTYLHQMPYPCYMIDNFLQMIQHVMPLCLSISFVYTVSMLTQTIVYEKELRLKEVMKIMGLNNSVHVFAWFITYFLQFTMIMSIVTCILHLGKILTHSDPWLIFFLLEIYACATICFSFLVSSLYSKAKLAAACAGILYFLSYVPCMYISIREDVAYEIIPWWAKTAASLLSTSAFGIGSKYIAFYENDGAGLQWKNIDKSPLENDEYNCLNCVIMMVIDCFVYLLLAWYIENVNPSYGIPLSWNYPFKISYWLGSTSQQKPPQIEMENKRTSFFLRPINWLVEKLKLGRYQSISHTESDQAKLLRNRLLAHTSDDSSPLGEQEKLPNSFKNRRFQRNQSSKSSLTRLDELRQGLFEPEPSNLNIGVAIRNLTKRYSDSKLAVDNLNLNFYENQITSFLGHNGAGKTTTISMLTGLIPATSGYAMIYDRDTRTDINMIRSNLGLCPQHNILFDKLTVEEHLWFYAKLKQMNDGSINELIENMLRDTGLKKKRNNMVNSLSGGMQRKLSVGIAFVGDANLVILDEPTAGVDPYARRAIWDMLLKYKEGRTIILSTHHMDEAELLGDRIAIISEGKLQCSGTSLFLKNALGEGNNLTLVKDMVQFELDIAQHKLEFNNDREKFLDQYSDEIKLDESCEIGPELFADLVAKNNCQELLKFVRSYIPSVILKEETLSEYQMVIPLSERSNQSYWNMFKDLEANQKRLRVSSYGIHDVSLEEIFIKAVQLKSKNEEKILGIQGEAEAEQTELLPPPPTVDSDENTSDIDENESSLTSSTDSQPNNNSISNSSLYNLDYIYIDLEKGSSLYLKQCLAIVIKRFLYNKRNWKSLMTQIILPALFICIAMTVALSAPGFLDLPQLELSTAQFYPLPLTKPDGIYVPFSYSNNASFSKFENTSASTNQAAATSIDIVSTLHFMVGIGSTCILNQRNLTLNDLLIMNNKTGNGIFNEKYFGNSDWCKIVLNQNCDIDYDYFPIGNSSAASSFLQRMHSKTPNRKFKNYFPDCNCLNDFSGFQCTGSYDTPSPFKLLTHETLLNITGENETEYYLFTTDLYRLKRYGGLSFDNERPPSPKNDQSTSRLIDQETIRNQSEIKKYELIQNLIKNRIARVWYNNKGFHAMPTFLNVMNNALLRANVKNRLNRESSINPNLKVMEYGITTINHPMNQTNNYLSTEYLLQGSDVLISIFTIVAMSFVNASFVIFLVYERGNKSLHLQFLMGLNPFIYWITNFIWDMINYMLPASCVIIIFKIFDVPAYVHGSNYPAVILLFLFYGWSVSPLMYPLTFIFKEPSNAYIFLIVINLFTGITCVESSFLLQVFSLQKDEQDLKFVFDTLKNVFLAFPPYCLGRGLIDIAYNDYYNLFYSKTGQLSKIKSPFEWDITTKNLVAMACIGCVSWIFTLLLEYDFFRFKWLPLVNKWNRPQQATPLSSPSRAYRAKEDPDVAHERARIEQQTNKSDRLIIKGLRKVYEKRNVFFGYYILEKLWSCLRNKQVKGNEFVAVKDLTFGVPGGECFGLLGVNGAGKTTTFKMLTTDLIPSSGSIFITGPNNQYIDALSNKNIFWNQIGYCPQFDALYDELTPAEHIKLFARLKGVKSRYEQVLCDSLLKRLDLTKYENKVTGSLSLGNKRKLSTALALVGNPSFILLDEPTTGQDPVSRRRLWEEIINLTRQKNRFVLLTSHSMEECEALCTRLAIMVDGKFKCMGSVQHLKTKFGEGYTLTVKLKEMPKHLSTISHQQHQQFSINKSNQCSPGKLEDYSDSNGECSYIKTRLDQAKPSTNKYINLILGELQENISTQCKLKERHFNNVYQFELPCPNLDTTIKTDNEFNIGDIYRLIELNKLKFNIADYSLSQNTLDNVFINFVKEQTKKRKRQQKTGNSLDDIEDDEQNYSSDESDNEFEFKKNTSTGAGSSRQLRSGNKHQSSQEIQFPIHDTDDLLIDLDDNLIDLDSAQLSLSDTHMNDQQAKFEISSHSNSSNSNKNSNVRYELKLDQLEIVEDDYC